MQLFKPNQKIYQRKTIFWYKNREGRVVMAQFVTKVEGTVAIQRTKPYLL